MSTSYLDALVMGKQPILFRVSAVCLCIFIFSSSSSSSSSECEVTIPRVIQVRARYSIAEDFILCTMHGPSLLVPWEIFQWKFGLPQCSLSQKPSFNSMVLFKSTVYVFILCVCVCVCVCVYYIPGCFGGGGVS